MRKVLLLLLTAALGAPGPALAQPAAPTVRTSPGAAPSFSAFTSQTAVVNGVRLHYRRGGRGDAVVLLHGWPGTSYTWRKVAPLLAARYTVIVPDLRGSGDSARPAGGYDAATLARDVRALVGQLGLRRVSVVGHDIGAHVAYAYARLYPGEVSHLAVMGAGVPDESWYGYPALPQPGAPVVGGFVNFALHATPDLPEFLTAGRERAYLEWSFGRLSLTPAAFTPADFDEYARTYARPGGMRGGFEYYRAFPVTIEQNRAWGQTRLTPPVLALDDQLTGDGIARQFRTLAADVRAAQCPCGHFNPEEAPDFVGRQLLDFLGTP